LTLVTSEGSSKGDQSSRLTERIRELLKVRKHQNNGSDGLQQWFTNFVDELNDVRARLRGSVQATVQEMEAEGSQVREDFQNYLDGEETRLRTETYALFKQFSGTAEKDLTQIQNNYATELQNQFVHAVEDSEQSFLSVLQGETEKLKSTLATHSNEIKNVSSERAGKMVDEAMNEVKQVMNDVEQQTKQRGTKIIEANVEQLKQTMDDASKQNLEQLKRVIGNSVKKVLEEFNKATRDSVIHFKQRIDEANKTMDEFAKQHIEELQRTVIEASKQHTESVARFKQRIDESNETMNELAKQHIEELKHTMTETSKQHMEQLKRALNESENSALVAFKKTADEKAVNSQQRLTEIRSKIEKKIDDVQTQIQLLESLDAHAREVAITLRDQTGTLEKETADTVSKLKDSLDKMNTLSEQLRMQAELLPDKVGTKLSERSSQLEREAMKELSTRWNNKKAEVTNEVKRGMSNFHDQVRATSKQLLEELSATQTYCASNLEKLQAKFDQRLKTLDEAMSNATEQQEAEHLNMLKRETETARTEFGEKIRFLQSGLSNLESQIHEMNERIVSAKQHSPTVPPRPPLSHTPRRGTARSIPTPSKEAVLKILNKNPWVSVDDPALGEVQVLVSLETKHFYCGVCPAQGDVLCKHSAKVASYLRDAGIET